MKGKYIGKDKEFSEDYAIWECPYCGKITYQVRWTDTGVIEDVSGCQHWTGTGDVEEYFEKEVKENEIPNVR